MRKYLNIIFIFFLSIMTEESETKSDKLIEQEQNKEHEENLEEQEPKKNGI